MIGKFICDTFSFLDKDTPGIATQLESTQLGTVAREIILYFYILLLNNTFVSNLWAIIANEHKTIAQFGMNSG